MSCPTPRVDLRRVVGAGPGLPTTRRNSTRRAALRRPRADGVRDGASTGFAWTLGFAVPPEALADRVAGALRSGTWTAPHFALDVATGWLTDGTAAAVEVTPAAAFAVGSGHAPGPVRLALASPALQTLSAALDVLAGIARATPEDTGVE
jgi:hypothetical protein